MSGHAGGLRVCIDAIPLLFRSAGIKNYLYYLIQHLQKLKFEGSVASFPWIRELGELHHDESNTGAAGTAARLALMHFLNLPGNHLMDWLGRDFDVFHACKLLHPPRSAKLTATIQDLTVWLFPGAHTRGVVEFEQAFADRILRHADGLIAASHSTRNDAARVLRLDPAKIHVVYHGVADGYYKVTPQDTVDARAKFNLKRRYILYIGTIEPRKNVDLLLEAYQALRPSVLEEVDLVLAGPRGWAMEQTLQRLATPPPGVRYLGYVPENDLPGLLAGAELLAYPSLYEGFGFPAAQAFAAGVPVVTSDVSSLREICADTAILVDPHSLANLTAGLESVLLSPSTSARLREAGKIRARDLTWDVCAARTLRFFQTVAG